MPTLCTTTRTRLRALQRHILFNFKLYGTEIYNENVIVTVMQLFRCITKNLNIDFLFPWSYLFATYIPPKILSSDIYRCPASWFPWADHSSTEKLIIQRKRESALRSTRKKRSRVQRPLVSWDRGNGSCANERKTSAWYYSLQTQLKLFYYRR